MQYISQNNRSVSPINRKSTTLKTAHPLDSTQTKTSQEFVTRPFQDHSPVITINQMNKISRRNYKVQSFDFSEPVRTSIQELVLDGEIRKLMHLVEMQALEINQWKIKSEKLEIQLMQQSSWQKSLEEHKQHIIKLNLEIKSGLQIQYALENTIREKDLLYQKILTEIQILKFQGEDQTQQGDQIQALRDQISKLKVKTQDQMKALITVQSAEITNFQASIQIEEIKTELGNQLKAKDQLILQLQQELLQQRIKRSDTSDNENALLKQRVETINEHVREMEQCCIQLKEKADCEIIKLNQNHKVSIQKIKQNFQTRLDELMADIQKLNVCLQEKDEEVDKFREQLSSQESKNTQLKQDLDQLIGKFQKIQQSHDTKQVKNYFRKSENSISSNEASLQKEQKEQKLNN